jgi:hypothetical protein
MSHILPFTTQDYRGGGSNWVVVGRVKGYCEYVAPLLTCVLGHIGSNVVYPCKIL